MSTNITPRNNFVILQLDAQPEELVTQSGLVLPDTVAETPDTATVVSVSEDTYDLSGAHVTLQLSPGDRVLFQPWNAKTFKVDGEEFLYIAYNAIVAVLS